MTDKTFDLQQYMTAAIGRIMLKAYASALVNSRQAQLVERIRRTFAASERRRAEVSEREGVDVPPFLIASIATTCNLNCVGCYARQNGIASQASSRETLSPEQWHSVMRQAADAGVNFALLAGGEPMMRRDVLEAVSQVEEMIFPVFTNGTFIQGTYLQFLKERLNLVPVVSIEGGDEATDSRRGAGVFRRALRAMEALHAERLFFGNSITVTTENFDLVTGDDFVGRLHGLGCKMIIYVEYVPTTAGTEHLALTPELSARMEQVQDYQRDRWPDMVILSFPGDERLMGGCLAGGRGFFHIGPDGAAEPCPFSPYSDSNVLSLGVVGALKSPLFRRLREARLVGGEHTGGCALFEHQDEVEALARGDC